MKIITVLLFCMFLNVCGFNKGTDNQMQKYGEKVSYSSGEELRFPDFSIKFIGKREEKLSSDMIFPLTMTFYDFEVAKDDAKQKISWSSGTGDIGPTFFDFNGAGYVLELAQSDIIKSLDEGVFVIWKKADYEAGIKRKIK